MNEITQQDREAAKERELAISAAVKKNWHRWDRLTRMFDAGIAFAGILHERGKAKEPVAGFLGIRFDQLVRDALIKSDNGPKEPGEAQEGERPLELIIERAIDLRDYPTIHMTSEFQRFFEYMTPGSRETFIFCKHFDYQVNKALSSERSRTEEIQKKFTECSEKYLECAEKYGKTVDAYSVAKACEHGLREQVEELQKKLSDAQDWKETALEELTLADRRISERDDKLKVAEEALEAIAKANCPKYMAHPQSVWWVVHIVPIAQKALANLQGKPGNSGGSANG